MNKLFIIILAVLVVLGIATYAKVGAPALGGNPSVSNVYTTSGGFTASTSTVNTTSTQLFSSVNQLAWVVNTSNSQITCSLDARGSTAVSSTVVAGRGVIIPATSTTNAAPSAAFGQCIPGVPNCYPHIGAVNCLAGAAVTVTKLVQ